MTRASCIIGGCDDAPIARGLCSKDYQRVKSAGRLDEVAPKVHPPCGRCGGVIPQERQFGSKFCSKLCKDAEMDARKQDVVLARRASRRIECAWCSTAIEQVRSDQRFCSTKCADNWKNEQTRLRTLRAKKAMDRPCEACGEQIPAARPLQSIYCSPECKAQAAAVINPKRRHTSIEYNRRYLYGLTPEQHAVLLAEQDGRCAICRTDVPGGKGAWHTDHCHDSGENRGLLCNGCNLGLGHFGDAPARLRAAAEYLEHHRELARNKS